MDADIGESTGASATRLPLVSLCSRRSYDARHIMPATAPAYGKPAIRTSVCGRSGRNVVTHSGCQRLVLRRIPALRVGFLSRREAGRVWQHSP